MAGVPGPLDRRAPTGEPRRDRLRAAPVRAARRVRPRHGRPAREQPQRRERQARQPRRLPVAAARDRAGARARERPGRARRRDQEARREDGWRRRPGATPTRPCRSRLRCLPRRRAACPTPTSSWTTTGTCTRSCCAERGDAPLFFQSTAPPGLSPENRGASPLSARECSLMRWRQTFRSSSHT